MSSSAQQQRKKRKLNRRRWLQKRPCLEVAPLPAAPAAPEPRSTLEVSPVEPPPMACASNSRVGRWGLGVVLLTVGAVYRGWRSRLAEVCSRLQDALFPWRRCSQELGALQQQVEELQRELSRLHGTLQLGGEVKSLSSCSGAAVCSLPVGHLTAPLLLAPPPPAPALLAPPPPPPPPPPPLPPAALLKRPLQILRKTLASKTPRSPPRKSDIPTAVTLRDLQAVKLRRVTNPIRKTRAPSPEKTRVPLVTVDELQRVNLRPHHALDLPPKLRIALARSPGKSPLTLRRQLKKVNIERSPGGTPLYDKENKETGTGLTPIMTQALRRKFQMAHPKSPSPKARAVNLSFDEQN
ncbi:proline-rich protein 11 isoform X2 [Amia ocellicauda]